MDAGEDDRTVETKMHLDRCTVGARLTTMKYGNKIRNPEKGW
jgi:hypothetical protein